MEPGTEEAMLMQLKKGQAETNERLDAIVILLQSLLDITDGILVAIGPNANAE